jgi:leucine dehydrogenase
MDRYLASLDHEEILIRRGTRTGLYCIVAVHSTARGPSLGGCRMWAYGDSRAALRDAMRLSEGMTYKAAVAGLAQGGGKGVIMAPVGERLEGRRRREALLDFGETVNRLEGRYITAEDVGISVDDIAVVSEVSPHVSALPREMGGSGDPSPWTALGVEVSIRVSCERVFGTSDMAGRSVSVIGLGHVGGNLAERLAAGGARLYVTDVDESRRELADRIGAQWVRPEEALFLDVDVAAPCALGGTLDHESVPRLRAKVVAGAANNQLADNSIDGLLAQRGILWAPDFVVNAGGIINIAVELEEGGYTEERADEHVRGIGETLRRIYDDAEAAGITPLAAAMDLARRRVAEGRAPAAA